MSVLSNTQTLGVLTSDGHLTVESNLPQDMILGGFEGKTRAELSFLFENSLNYDPDIIVTATASKNSCVMLFNRLIIGSYVSIVGRARESLVTHSVQQHKRHNKRVLQVLSNAAQS